MSILFQQELLNLRAKVALLVAHIPKDIPGLTVHDITHLDALWETGSLVVGPRYPLNPAEAYVLGAAILLHDAGLSLASYPDGIEGIKATTEWRDTVTLLLRDEGVRSPNDTQIVDPPEEIRKRAVARVLRSLHAAHSEKLPFVQWHGNDSCHGQFLIDNGDLRTFYGPLIGKVARSHHLNVPELPSYLGGHVGAFSRAPLTWAVDPVKVACILRAADVAHLDERRAPRFLQLLSKLEGQSAIHWTFQSKLAKVRMEKDALVFTSGVGFSLRDADAWWLCYDAAQVVDRELHQVDLLVDKLSIPRFTARRVLGIESPAAFSASVRTEGWVPVDTHIRVSHVPSIVKLLGGSHLYGDNPSVAIRELIQNGADAIRARRLIEGRSPKDWRVLVRLSNPGGEWWLDVADTGVGMSEGTLTGELLDFGKPFWSGETVINQFPGLIANGMNATGRFGIGFFSVFMLGDFVRVVSRRFDASAQSTQVLEFRSGLDLQPILRKAERKELILEGGTCVSVRLKLDPFRKGGILAREIGDKKIEKLELKSLIASLCPTIDVNVSVETNGRERVCVIAGDWQKLDGAKLLQRIAGPDFVKGVPTKGEDIYPSHIKSLVDESGVVHGRACIVAAHDYFMKFHGVTTVGGLRAEGLSRLGGVLCANTEVVSRDRATSTVDRDTLGRWASEQARLIARSKLLPDEKLRAAHIVLRCGGVVDDLPIAIRGNTYLNYREVLTVLSKEEEINVFQEARVTYDEDADNCHPKEFEGLFATDERLFFVWDDEVTISNIRRGEPRRDFLQVVPQIRTSSLYRLFRKALVEQWGPDYEEFYEERRVGEVDGSEILRDVSVYRRKRQLG